MPICDICSMSMRFADGYSLTTKEVVLSTAYWMQALRGGFAVLHERDPNGGDQLMHHIEQQAAQHTGWLVCEECSKPLSFDRTCARQLAEQQQNPPKAGSVAPRDVARHATEAWKNLYGSAPRMTKFSDVIVSIDRDSNDVRVLRPEEQKKPEEVDDDFERGIKLRLNGDFTSSERLLRKALVENSQRYGEKDFNTQVALSQLGRTLREMNVFDEACELHERVLKIRRDVYGNDHEFTHNSMLILAETLLKAGQNDRAKLLLAEASKKKLIYHPDKETNKVNTEIPPDPVLSEKEVMLNACSNVLGYKNDGGIRFIKQGTHIAGIWVRGFPDNTTKKHFLMTYCISEKEKSAGILISKGAYKITRATDGNGFDILFE